MPPEPTVNLDQAASLNIMEICRHLNEDRRLTLVMVNHDPDMAAYARRLAVLRDGAVAGDRRVEEAPPETRVAGY